MPNITKIKRPWIKSSKKKGSWNTSGFNYHTQRWRNVRKDYLNRHPLCVRRERPASVVDHIIPIADGGAEWEESNFQAMCQSCHNKKSAKESNR